MLYFRDLPADSPSKKTIEYHLKALNPFWGAKSLGDVKGSTCREYILKRVTGTKSSEPLTTWKGKSTTCVMPSTARQELKTFQAAINHWHKESPLAAVPKVTLPKPGERRERVLERSEVARMLWACRKLSRTPTYSPRGAQVFRDYSYVARFILIGKETGTRHEAILGMQWEVNKSGGYYDDVRNILYRRGTHERDIKAPPGCHSIGTACCLPSKMESK